MNEENVPDANSNTSTETEPNTVENTETTVEETKEESIEEVKAKLAKAEELAKNQRIRAEKAEKNAKESNVESKVKGDMSLQDIRALQDVHDEDVDDVVEWAKFKKISVAEARKSDNIKTLLKDKEEKRKAAAFTNTGSARRSSVKLSDEDIVEAASRGEFPEDPEVLARAETNLKKKK